MPNLTPEQRQRLIGLETDGRLTATDVVEDARGVKSPLHPLFEWDDEKAAHEHRLDQARALIREVMVTIRTTTTSIEVVRYVPDPDRGRDQGYINLTDIQDDDLRRRATIAEANRALGVMRRAADIAEALGLDGPAHACVEQWIAWRDSVEDAGGGLRAAAAD